MSKYLITGGSGLVGSRLTEILLSEGHLVSHLGRLKPGHSDVKEFTWDVKNQSIEKGTFDEVDYVIHLAGAGIADERWTDKRKQILINSRIQTTQLLVKELDQLESKPKKVACASAIGYYGFNTSQHINEESQDPASGFLPKLTSDWEKAMDGIEEAGVPVVKLRIGLVLSAKGGALVEMAKPVKLFAGVALGSGKQWMPWIHIDDLCRMFIHLANTDKIGSFNAAAPTKNQVTNAEFTKQLGKKLSRPIWPINAPSFVLKMVVGEMAPLVLEGERVETKKVESTGFNFSYSSLKEALNKIY